MLNWNTTMDYKILLTVFITVFIAELGDKTQIATLLFATNKDVNKLTIFLGASIALIVTSAIGVFAGGIISEYVSEKTLKIIAGIGFVIIGIWSIYQGI